MIPGREVGNYLSSGFVLSLVILLSAKQGFRHNKRVCNKIKTS
jgi:hypothetical protein